MDVQNTSLEVELSPQAYEVARAYETAGPKEQYVSLNACIELTLLSLPKQLSKIKGQFPQKCCRFMCNYFCDCPIFKVSDVPDHDNKWKMSADQRFA